MDAITVTLTGKKSIDVSDSLISLYVEKEINQMPFSNLQFTTGTFADRNYSLFDESMFKIGEDIEIKIRYESSGQKDTSIFRGIITNVAFGVHEGLPSMNLTLKDPCFRLFESVNTELFNRKSDEHMISSVCLNSGVNLKKTPSSLSIVSFDQYVKKQNSDWIFVSERLAAHGLLGVWENGTLSALELKQTIGSFNLDLGIDEILDFKLEEDASVLNQEVRVNYWNLEHNKLETVQRRSVIPAAKDAKTATSEYTFLGITEKNEAEAMLNHFACVQELSSVNGTIDITGNASVELMQKLSLRGFPKTFNRSFPITKVVHSIQFGVWKTTVGIGSKRVAVESSNLIARYSSNQPTEIQTATVLKWQKDPKNWGRIPVRVLGFSKNIYWAYPGQVSAGKRQSSYILPEEGEQVMIGFMHGNYNQGVILTSIYSGSSKPPSPFKLDSKSAFGFISKSGLKQIFDDEKKSVETSSSSDTKLVLNNTSGIELTTKKNLKTSSELGTEIKASSTVKIKGSTIDLN